jgi:hypothetical protein
MIWILSILLQSAILDASVVEDDLRETYQSQKWEKFFAYARYYREGLDSSQQSEVILLEPLALLRHCQGEAVESVAAAIEKDHPGFKDSLSQMRALAQTRFAGKQAKRAGEHDSGFVKHFKGKQLQKLKKVDWTKVDPQKLIIRVENLCE